MIEWPAIVPIQHVTIGREGASRSAGRTLGGAERIVKVDAGYWTARLELPPMYEAAQINAYRAMIAQLNGRAGTLAVPFCDIRHGPAALLAAQMGQTAFRAAYPSPIPHDDDALFDDDSGYASDFVYATLGVDLALRQADTIINVTSGHEIAPGMYFSIGSRAYIIQTCVNEGVDDNDWVVTFWPPARAASSFGDAVRFDSVTCEMRLASESTGVLTLAYKSWSQPVALDFTEAAL